jgi:anthranilate/para-aminobenzoate synthase component I
MLEKVDTILELPRKSPALVGVRVDAPPDALRLAASLRGLPGRCVLASATPPDDGGPWRSYVTASPSEQSDELCPEGGVTGARDTPWGFVPRWIGLLPYEHARHLERAAWTRRDHRPAPHHLRARWHRYDAALVIDHGEGSVHAVGQDVALVHELARRAGLVGLGRSAGTVRSHAAKASVTLLDEGGLDAHADRIRQALKLIAQGDLYQVNLARRVRLEVLGEPFAAFERMMRASPTSLAAAIEFPDHPMVYSTSPELFLLASPRGQVTTVPIKGTRPRGRDADDDLAQRLALDADPKERAELTMVIDLERNDLGRLAEVGSVRVPAPPRVVTHRTLHHRKADVTAMLPPGTTWAELLRASFPSGSVTGAPKVRAMEVIASLEPARRGLYTGALGFVSRDGALCLSMAIRTLTVSEGEGHYHVGGGIVADSDPDRELEETRVKALQLASVLRGG